mmetsp:Transcript_119961/g.344811  ORF Transcript_119961/g.344811 Transcript_119961/m.344811 type:complete len:246 (+) Transcript_119961:427-1164(+)
MARRGARGGARHARPAGRVGRRIPRGGRPPRGGLAKAGGDLERFVRGGAGVGALPVAPDSGGPGLRARRGPRPGLRRPHSLAAEGRPGLGRWRQGLRVGDEHRAGRLRGREPRRRRLGGAGGALRAISLRLDCMGPGGGGCDRDGAQCLHGPRGPPKAHPGPGRVPAHFSKPCAAPGRKKGIEPLGPCVRARPWRAACCGRFPPRLAAEFVPSLVSPSRHVFSALSPAAAWSRAAPLACPRACVQ